MLAALLAACTPTPEPLPTEAEALALFQEAFQRAQAEDFSGLCELGGGNCQRILEAAGRDVPREDPEVVVLRALQPSTNRSGGIVLGICGSLNTGEPYYTEMLVFRDRGRQGGLEGLHAIEPVYWSGVAIADDSEVGGEQTDPGSHC